MIFDMTHGYSVQEKNDPWVALAHKADRDIAEVGLSKI